MIFLKRFEAQGFKSFAKYTQTVFEHPITGIIGPNGTGKSNIIDALRWVLGEHSKAALRGDKYSLAFLGNDLVKKATFIRVSLYFNNVHKILYTDLEEVKITKFYDLKKDDVVYYINDQVAKFKDIQDMFLDSGLLKGSLGIISQGSVSWFAEAKPIERRRMFDEAAGIGKYFKRKKDAETNLEKSTTDLNRLNDNLYGLKKDLNAYTKQKEDFLKYMAIKDELESLELNLYAKILTHNYRYKNELKDQLSTVEERIVDLQPEIDQLTIQNNKNKQRLQHLQTQLNYDENERDKLYDQLSLVNQRLNEHKMFLKNQADNLNNNPQERFDNYQALKQENLLKIEQLNQLIDEKNAEIKQVQVQLSTNKTQQLTNINQRSDLNTQKNNLNYKISDYQNTVANELARERGTNNIMQAQDFIPGIYATVLQAIKTKQEHELAINTALGKNIYNIIVQNNQVAQNCVDYLKNNRAGQAVFLPLTNLKPKSIKPEFYDAIETLQGFVGVAKDLVQINPKYQVVADYLLGNIIIAQNLTDALLISQTSYQNYKVITLDGQIVFTGGAIMGGDMSIRRSNLNMEEKIAELQTILNDVNSRINVLNGLINDNNYETNLLENKLSNLYNDLSSLNSQFKTAETEDKRLAIELEKIASLHTDLTTREQQVSVINQEYETINQRFLKQLAIVKEVQNEISTLNNFIQQDMISKEQKYTTYNKLLNEKNKLQEQFNSNQNSIIKYETVIIEEYQYTIDNVFEKYLNIPLTYTEHQALEKINNLKIQKSSFKNINFNVLNEYEAKKQEFQNLQQEVTNCENAVQVIKNTIKTLDQQAKADFKKVIKAVNAMIPQIFGYFFEQGTCQILLEDEQNVLQSGIEVIANPMNKKNVSLHQLSGGEKTLVVLVILFALLKVAKFPLVILDEAEAALDEINVDKFARMIQNFAANTQFLIITHRQGTMRNCGVLIGTTMHKDNVSLLTKINLDEQIYKFEEQEEN
ncbi:AAA family ATPase [Ureaplasma sp. ES3154-GEN]|uniref:AAA family ATPase n=1 Tax=Ureaplasma sp. ES3154-GEN TaxID=2984844 RepID=UPI0021E90EE5|nr:AAA family ATPase [Ureaplasma sp. ES3154-GEN]MCV3743521.1 AAA family ATPase [Ureaplasma sp. ES3154-GEN]